MTRFILKDSLGNELRIDRIIFSKNVPGIGFVDVSVRPEYAFDYYLSNQGDEVKGAMLAEKVASKLVNQVAEKTFFTYAKQWTVWDDERKLHHISRIGLGADGESGEPIRNPRVTVGAFSVTIDAHPSPWIEKTILEAITRAQQVAAARIPQEA